MASLDRRTSGIAHEMKQPCSFINNVEEPFVDIAKDLRATDDLDNVHPGQLLKDTPSKINPHEKFADFSFRDTMQLARCGTRWNRSHPTVNASPLRSSCRHQGLVRSIS